MKDLLTTAASLIIILFCFSLLFQSEGMENVPEEAAQLAMHNSEIQSGFSPPVKSTLFNRVQSVKVRKGVLMFANLEQGKLKEHYFLIRDKNVILTKEPDGNMPHHTIKFEDDGKSAMRVTISTSLDIDLLEEMASN